jgi:hypothetical protein
MNRAVVSRTRSRRAAATADQSGVRALGKQVETRFRKAAAQAVKQAHASNVPVAVLTADNQVAWVHPDGVVRPTREPARETDAQ